MTSITANVKYRVRTTGLEHQGQNSISDPDQNLGFTCIFFIRYARTDALWLIAILIIPIRQTAYQLLESS